MPWVGGLVDGVPLTITFFLSAVSGYDPPLNAVMMLWVNLIMVGGWVGKGRSGGSNALL